MVKHSREIRTARYSNANYQACAIVAAVNYHDGELFDWAAYIGGCDHRLREREAVAWVAENGDKMSRRDAAHFFPSLPINKYRGW